MFTGVAHKHLKGAYKGLQKFLQCEVAFVQHVTQVLGDDFSPLHKALREYFLLSLFLGIEAHMPAQKYID